MVIGIIVVVLASGQMVHDAALFGTEKECLEANAEVIKAVNEKASTVAVYDVRCIDLKKMHKPGANT